MALTLNEYTGAIAHHSEALAVAAAGSLARPIEHCPGWLVEDVLRHLLRVHWFWASIVEERRAEPPTDGGPDDVATADLPERYLQGAHHLVAVLNDADQRDVVYTWAPSQRDVAFITRHQVQEIAVHHWDVANAVGAAIAIEGDVARDAVEEFLTFSVSSEVDPADPPRPALNGRLALRCSDDPRGWTIMDGSSPGVVGFREDVLDATPSITATSSDLLLWLYQRVTIATEPSVAELADRFRALTYTD